MTSAVLEHLDFSESQVGGHERGRDGRRRGSRRPGRRDTQRRV